MLQSTHLLLLMAVVYAQSQSGSEKVLASEKNYFAVEKCRKYLSCVLNVVFISTKGDLLSLNQTQCSVSLVNVAQCKLCA